MTQGPHTNRIKELREMLGLTQEQLAGRLGTLPQQVGKHERGERRLTIQWMQRYAAALEVAPADLISSDMPLDMQSDVELATVDQMPGVSAAIATRGLRIYRVLQSFISDAGMTSGTYITVDESPETVAKAAAGDVVIAEIVGTDVLLLRQFVPPATLITNRAGHRNTLQRLDDRSVPMRLRGVVISR